MDHDEAPKGFSVALGWAFLDRDSTQLFNSDNIAGFRGSPSERASIFKGLVHDLGQLIAIEAQGKAELLDHIGRDVIKLLAGSAATTFVKLHAAEEATIKDFAQDAATEVILRAMKPGEKTE